MNRPPFLHTTARAIKTPVLAVHHLLIPAEKKSRFSLCMHQHTFAFVPPSCLNFPLQCFLSGPKKWKLLCARSGLHGGWVRHFQQKCSRNSTVTEVGTIVEDCFLWAGQALFHSQDILHVLQCYSVGIFIQCFPLAQKLRRMGMSCASQNATNNTFPTDCKEVNFTFKACGVFTLQGFCLKCHGKVKNPCFLSSDGATKEIWIWRKIMPVFWNRHGIFFLEFLSMGQYWVQTVTIQQQGTWTMSSGWITLVCMYRKRPFSITPVST